MRFLIVIFFSFSTLFMSGCLWDEEEVRGPISDGLSPKKLFNKAEDFLDQGALDEAIKIYEQLQAAYPASKYALQARIELIYSHYKKENYDLAIDKANDFIKLYPSDFATPYAYYLRGISAEDKSRSILDDYITDNAQRDVSSAIDAFNYYLDLINKFPESKYSEEAKTRLIIIRNIISRHELFIAIFYTKKKAHIAAINRCNFLISKYPNTPSVPAALHLLAYNYDAIDAKDLAIDTRRVLKESYPLYQPHYTLKD